MKIEFEINENETYSMNVDNKITRRQFPMFLERIQALGKIMSKDVLTETIEKVSKTETIEVKPFKHKTMSYNEWAKERDSSIEVCKAYYTKDKKEIQKVVDKYNLDWKKAKNAVYYTVKRWKIKPFEVGLLRFPTQKR